MIFVSRIRINKKSKCIVNQSWEENVEMWTSCVKTRILVYFKKPNSKVFINDKIVAKHFKTILNIIPIHQLSNAQNCINDDILCPWQNVFFKVDAILRELAVKISLKSIKRKCIPILMFCIFATLLLKTTICQMNKVVSS